LNDNTYNRYAIGALITVDGKIIRRMTATSGAAMGSVHQDIHLGLGEKSVSRLAIQWPDGDLAEENITLEKTAFNTTLCIVRHKGVQPCGSERFQSVQQQSRH
jgi:hypothetical protein